MRAPPPRVPPRHSPVTVVPQHSCGGSDFAEKAAGGTRCRVPAVTLGGAACKPRLSQGPPGLPRPSGSESLGGVWGAVFDMTSGALFLECEQWDLAESSGEGAEARSRPRPQGRVQAGPWASCLPEAKGAVLVGTCLQTALPNFVGTLRKKLLAREGHRAPVPGASFGVRVVWEWPHRASQEPAPPSTCFRTQGLTDSPLSLSRRSQPPWAPALCPPGLAPGPRAAAASSSPRPLTCHQQSGLGGGGLGCWASPSRPHPPPSFPHCRV